MDKHLIGNFSWSYGIGSWLGRFIFIKTVEKSKKLIMDNALIIILKQEPWTEHYGEILESKSIIRKVPGFYKQAGCDGFQFYIKHWFA